LHDRVGYRPPTDESAGLREKGQSVPVVPVGRSSRRATATLHSGSPGRPGGYTARMPDIAVTLNEAGEAYVALVTGRPPEVRHSVALDALEEADTIPALEGLVLDFDYYGRVVGLRVTSAADSVLAPSLLEAAEPGDPPSAEVS
jgi:hypothetical protein